MKRSETRPTWTGLPDLEEPDRYDGGDRLARENERNLRARIGDDLYNWLDREDPKEPYWYKPGMRIHEGLKGGAP